MGIIACCLENFQRVKKVVSNWLSVVSHQWLVVRGIVVSDQQSGSWSQTMGRAASIEQHQVIPMYDFVVITVAEDFFDVCGMFASEFGSVYGVVVHQTACELHAVFSEA